jgi:hypothetical protein
MVQIRIRLVRVDPPEGLLWVEGLHTLHRRAASGEPLRFAGWLDLLRTLDEVFRANGAD